MRLNKKKQEIVKTPNYKCKNDIYAILFIYLTVIVMFGNIVFKNEVFSNSGDTAAALSISEGGKFLEETENIEPQWFPFIFSGMPSFGSLMYLAKDINYGTIVLHFIGKILFLGSDLSWMIMHFFFAALGVYFFSRYNKISIFSSLFASFVFLMCPYVVGLGQAGHGSKLMALSFIPYLFLATKYLIDKKNILGISILAILSGTFLLTNHVQIVYYGFLSIGTYFIVFSFQDFKEKKFISLPYFIIAIIIGFAISTFIYYSTYDYSQFSIRGGENGIGSGLNKEYATNWSFNPLEFLNYFIPSFFGFQSPYYWGWMPFTESSVYIGLLPIVFSVIAIIWKRNLTTIFFLSLTIFYFLISFGKHFFFYDLLFNYLPFFNKFRAPSMILLLVPFSVGIIAAFGIDSLQEKIKNLKTEKKFSQIILILLGISVLLFILSIQITPSIFPKNSFSSNDDTKYSIEQVNQLKEIRFEILKYDMKKMAIIAIFICTILFLYAKKILKQNIAIIVIILVFIIDIGIINKGFSPIKLIPDLKLGGFLQTISNEKTENFEATKVVKFLQEENKKNSFRIFPIGNSFSDNSFMYHNLQTIGGYSPAKLRIYQEMLDSCLYKSDEPNFPLNMNILNMLNVKYVIANGGLPEDKFAFIFEDEQKKEYLFENKLYLERAFFVDSIVKTNKTQTFQILNSIDFNAKETAILPLDFKEKIEPQKNSSIQIQKGAHRISLQTKNDATSLLVLSEIYYPSGWKAFIDGKETKIYKTNNLLRSIVVPKGNHKIEFVYESEIYSIGLYISYFGWSLSFITLLFGLYFNTDIKKKFQKA